MRPGAISRRRFVAGAGAVGVSATGLGLLVGCGRLPWQAAPAKVPRIGLLGQGSSGPSSRDSFFQGLHDLGYTEGQNLLVESRYAEAEVDRAPVLAAELVHLPVDVIVAGGARWILAAKQATSSTPIVMAFTSMDPIAEGLIASLARPGGNITGLTSNVQGAQLGAKRLELVREALPGIARVAVLWDEGDPVHVARWGEIQTAGPILGLQVQSLALRDPADLMGAFVAAAAEHAEALIVLTNTLTASRMRRPILDLVARSRLPAMYEDQDWVRDGALMAYGPSVPAMWYRAAYYVDRILKGTNPADLPIEQPMRFDFVVNLTTARKLGVTFPNEIMLQVTEVIQ
jgi:putative tryptophan/tyrosine transport system substrate-binding protein